MRRWPGIVVQLKCYLDAVTMHDRFVEAFLDKFPLKPCCGFAARGRYRIQLRSTLKSTTISIRSGIS
jgi:hypothetical protein